jgi:predicted CopG family antitoxin
MATKTVTLEVDAYEKLRRAKRSPRVGVGEPLGELHRRHNVMKTC